MNLLSLKTIKEIIAEHGARPLKGLGQNFLIDRNVLEKIIKTAEINPQDNILEIGPGIGTLTQELAKRAGKVIAVEKDEIMVEILTDTLKNFKNIEIIQGDILKISNFKFQITNYKVVANIPYYLTSPLIRKFLADIGSPPTEMVLMVQKEVAQRICAKPPEMSLLAVAVQFYANPKIISYVSKNCFWPAPKVDSAIIKITPKNGGLPMSAEFFFKIVKAGFSQPRKQLAGNLSKGLKIDRKKADEWLLKNNINPSRRAETLSINDWENLARTLPCG